MGRVEREIKVISEKGWGWWDYKAGGCPGKQRKFHIVDCLHTYFANTCSSQRSESGSSAI